MNLYYEIGLAGKLSIACFLATLVFAGVILIRRLGMRYRVALLPLSLLPLVLGIHGAASGVIQSIDFVRSSCVYDPFSGLVYFSETLRIMPLAAAESALLLVVTAAMLMLSPDPHR